MDCPNCGNATVPTPDPSPATPPHHCPACSRLWWDPELTPQARALWNKSRRDFGFTEAAQMIRLHAQVARDQARERRFDRRDNPGQGQGQGG